MIVTSMSTCKKREGARPVYQAVFLLLILLSMAVPLPASAAPATDASGDYLLTDLSDLTWFRQQVNGGNNAINAKLTNDVDLGSQQWTPIGLADAPYVGTFDGNGKTVSNLSITDLTGAEKGYFGFFGCVGADIEHTGAIQNLTVRTVRIEVSRMSVTVNAGAIAGNNAGASILSSAVRDVRIAVSADSALVGGAVGDASNYAVLKEITAENVVIDAANSQNNSGTVYAGGIAGALRYNAVMRDCAVGAGTIAAVATKTTSTINASNVAAGGAIGYELQARIIGVSVRDLDVYAKSLGYTYAGGLVGSMAGISDALDSCFVRDVDVRAEIGATGTDGTNNEYAYAGGVAGYAAGTIQNAQADGVNVAARTEAKGKLSVFSGGIVGYTINLVKSCKISGSTVAAYNAGAASPTSPRSYNGAYSGAIAGSAYGTLSYRNGAWQMLLASVENCLVDGCAVYAENNVTQAFNGTRYVRSCAGGIVGWNRFFSTTAEDGLYTGTPATVNCTVLSADISSSQSKDGAVTGTVAGEPSAGAIVGLNEGTAEDSLYVQGAVSGDVAVGSGDAADASVTSFAPGAAAKTTSLFLDITSLTLAKSGDSATLAIAAYPVEEGGLVYTWSSSDPAFVQVAGSGKTAIVTMLADYGSATVACNVQGELVSLDLTCAIAAARGAEDPDSGTDPGGDGSTPDGGEGSSQIGGSGGCSAFASPALLLLALMGAAIVRARQ